MESSLSARDRRLLGALASEGRLTNAELAERIGMSPSNCLRRTRALEAQGVIRGYAAILDVRALGYRLAAYLLVDLDQRIETDAEAFFELVRAEPRIVECAAVTGASDVLIKAVARDIEDLGDLTMRRLLKLPSVKKVTSCVVMQMVKEGPILVGAAS